jgi:hypothetical protein
MSCGIYVKFFFSFTGRKGVDIWFVASIFVLYRCGFVVSLARCSYAGSFVFFIDVLELVYL